MAEFSTLDVGTTCTTTKQPDLKLKTRPKQLLGYLLLTFYTPSLILFWLFRPALATVFNFKSGCFVVMHVVPTSRVENSTIS
jgi:hypothetical protein